MLRKNVVRVVAALALTLVVGLSPIVDQGKQAAAASETDWIVVFQPATAKAERAAAARGAGASVRFNYDVIDAVAVRAGPGAIAALRRHGRVVSIVADNVVSALLAPEPGALGKPGGGGGGTAPQTLPLGVQRIGADQVWHRATAPLTGAGVGVAVADTGIDFAHGDLSVSPSCFTVYASCQDDNGHGTHVAGTIAARDNAQDVVGVAPGATLYAVKVLDRGGKGLDSAIIAGLDWVFNNHLTLAPQIRVVNMSLGRGKASSDTLDANDPLWSAVNRLYGLGITVVVAAGNDGSKEVSQMVPATYPQALAIASTTAADGTNACRSYTGSVKADSASYYSTDGRYDPASRVGVTISAPGEDRENISRGCSLQTVGILSTKLGGGTTRMSGTSMAAPHVAGVVALMSQAAGGAIDPETARAKLRTSADRIGVAPLDSPASRYSYDGEREGVLSAPGATS